MGDRELIKQIREMLSELNSLHEEMALKADWFNDELYKNSRFSNYKIGQIVVLKDEINQQYQVFDFGYSEKHKCFAYRLINLTNFTVTKYILEPEISKKPNE